jgi:hypothetical protein
MLHQAKDEANADQSAKEAQDQERNRQSAAAAAAAAPVPVAQKAAAPPTGGALTLASTTDKSGQSTGAGENDAPGASDDQKKADATAITGATFLLQAIAGLGIPQLAQPVPLEAASVQKAPTGRDESRASAAVATAGAIAVADETSSAQSLSASAAASQKDAGGESPVPTTPPEGDANAPQPSGQLAFAARLNADASGAQTSSQPQQPASRPHDAPADGQSSTSTESDTIQPAAAVVQPVQAGSEQTEDHAQKSTGDAMPAPSTAAEQFAAARTDAARALDQPADVRSADVDQTPAAGASATAVRDVQLQVVGSDNQRVDVRVMDRGGELRVSVRADDPSLVRSLQDNVADLSTRLDQAHFQSEVWTPRTQAIGQTDSANTNGRTFSNGGETFGRDGQGQQQNGRQQQQPSWVDDFEESPAGRNSGSTQQWQP